MSRKAFESWHGGLYRGQQEEIAWAAWQAAAIHIAKPQAEPPTDDDLLRIATSLGLPFGMLDHDYCKATGLDLGTRSHGEVSCDGMVRFARAVIAALPQSHAPQAKPVAWQGAEEWESLAWELCADENGEDACNELIWEGGPVPEPWGDRWLKYEGEAKRLIALVRKHVAAPQAQPAVPPDMVLVPREPTDAMKVAAWKEQDAIGEWPTRIWRAMLAAAPSAVPVPLTEKFIVAVADQLWESGHIQSISKDTAQIFARAIERAHGIGEAKNV